jgi:hypothetical protein
LTVNKILIAVVSAAALGACSSSNPCQTSITPYNFGDCPDFADAGGFVTITPAQRSACEVACSSSTDQTALTNLITCVNNVPGQVGACTAATEQTWANNAEQKLIACNTAAANQPSQACLAAVESTPDAG